MTEVANETGPISTSIHHDVLAKNTPLRRIGEPREIAGAAVFLASDASTFMTGQAMIVDGGSTIGVGL